MKTAFVVTAVAAFIAMAVAVLWIGLGTMNGTATGDMVRIQRVTAGELVQTVSAPGKVQPKTKVTISAKVSSLIEELPFKEGMRVTKGDPDADPPVPASVLVKLDASDLEAQLRSARALYAAQAAQIEVENANITSQEATLKAQSVALADAERNLQRNTELRQTQDISQSALDEAQMQRDQLAAECAAAKSTLEARQRGLTVMQYNLEAAKADIARAEDELRYTTITAPIDGVVTRLNAEVGELVVTGTMNNPGTSIMEVADLSTMLVIAELDETNVGLVHEGQAVHIRLLSDPDRVYEGKVEKVALKATDAQPRYFETQILIETDGERLYSGLTADAEIEVNHYKDVLTVPSQAVLGRSYDDLPAEVRRDNALVDPNKAVATVVYRMIDGKAVVTPVRVGASNLTDTVITDGLKEGDRVIIGPYKVLETLAHGQHVVDEDADPTPAR